MSNKGIETSTNPTGADWHKTLDGLPPGHEVTVWLGTGWSVTGTVNDKDPSEWVFRINGAKLVRLKSDGNQPEGVSGLQPFVLVPVKDIELITWGFQEPKKGPGS
jgi:hypothetical protein